MYFHSLFESIQKELNQFQKIKPFVHNFDLVTTLWLSISKSFMHETTTQHFMQHLFLQNQNQHYGRLPHHFGSISNNLASKLPLFFCLWSRKGRDNLLLSISHPIQACKRSVLVQDFTLTHNKTYSRIKLIIASKIARKTQTSYLS